MARPIYLQTEIAVVWDFDRTLIPGYSQVPLFDKYKVDGEKFWKEVNALKGLYEGRGLHVGEDTAYLLHMLTYVREGIFGGLTNTALRQLGADIAMCPGIPNFLQELQQIVRDDERFARHGVKLEHYVVSTGIRQMIEGSAVGPFVAGVWANEFVDQPPPPGFLEDEYKFNAEGEIAQIGYMIDNTSKTRAVFEINKGPDVNVNALVAPEQRKVPFQNMIYVADGPSDVPVFSVVNSQGGRTLGVYQSGEKTNFQNVKRLELDGRVHSIAPADFSAGTQAYLWITDEVRQIADRICSLRERHIAEIRAPGGHVT